MAALSLFNRSADLETGHGETVMIVGWSLLFASTTIVGLRLYTRVSRVHSVKLDDHLMIIAWFLELMHMVFISIAFSHGLGQHFDDLSPSDKETALFYQIGFIELFAVTPCMFGRISFAVFLLYLLGRTAKWKRTILWAIIAVQIIINLIVIVQIYAQCGLHFNALWNPKVAEIAHCQSPTVETYIGYVQSGLNSLCDVTLTIIPAFILWGLQMPRREKITLSCVLMLSIFAFAASLVKAVEIRNLTETLDFTWFMADLQLWVCVENNVVMMAASTPGLRPLLRRKTGHAYQNDTPYDVSHELSYRSAWPASQHDKKSRIAHSAHASAIDNISEERILDNGDQHILKTTGVSVTYGRGSGLE